MNRRPLLVSMLAASKCFVLTPLMGCRMSTTNIRSFGTTFTYLKDPEFRRSETGNSLLIVELANFSGEQFDEQVWDNIRFVDCEFLGAYQIRLNALRNCRFEGCRFTGVIGWGTTENVVFSNCHVTGDSNIAGGVGSRNVRFETCTFQGPNSEPNYWGTMGTYGQAEYVKCNAKWFSVFGCEQLILRDCKFDDAEVRTDSPANSGQSYQQSTVLIEHCQLRGTFDMAATHLKSLTIRDTVLDSLNLTDATVKGDVVMERIKGGYINAYVAQAKSLSLRNSQIYGNGAKVFEAYAGGICSIEIDTVIFGGDLSTEPVTIAGGTGADLNNVRARVNDEIIIRKSKVPRLSTHHLNTSLLQVVDCDLGSVDLSSGRIAKLEINSNTIARSVDFTNTQAEESKVQPFAKGQAKLDGSNIKPT